MRRLSYVPGSSLLHRLHPICKLLLLLIYTGVVWTNSHLPFAAGLLGLLLISFWAAGLGFMGRSRRIISFSVMILLVQTLFVRQGAPLCQLNVGRLTVAFWSGGLAAGAVAVLRFLNTIGSSYLFIAMTDPNHLAVALMQAGLPYRQGFMLITALRFLPLFQYELTQIQRAQMAKGIDLEGLGPRKLAAAVRHLLIPLVLSALGKVDSLAISMEGRAFGLHPKRTYRVQCRFSPKDWLILLLFPLLLHSLGLILS